MSDKKYMSQSKKTTDIKAFVNFMKTHQISSDDKETVITHTLMGPLHPALAPFKGKFHISDSDYPKFLRLYKLAIEGMSMHIVERPKENGPMVIDIDFKTSSKHKERQYLDSHIELVIELYNKHFKHYLKALDRNMNAFVFEKPEPTYDQKNKEYKDGFHIIYPDIPLDVSQRYFFYHKVKKDIEEGDLFKDIPFTNTYKDILDPSVVNNNGILMYGASKEGRDPYELTKIYKHDFKVIPINEYNDEYLVGELSIRKYGNDDTTNYGSKQHEEEAAEIYELYKSGGTKKKNNVSTINDEKIKQVAEKINREFPQADKNDQYQMVEGLTNILSSHRSYDYHEWIRVCWALRNISPSYFNIFVNFSKKCTSKFSLEYCKQIWSSGRTQGTGYTMASLHWWARTDNKEAYLKLMREQVKSYIVKAKSGTHDDVANVVREMYKSLYKCVDITKNVWYEFQEHRWVQIDSAYTLSEKISDELTREFFTLMQTNLHEASTEVSLNYDESIKDIKTITKLTGNLKNAGFKKSVIELCRHKFYDKNAQEKFDCNPMLIGFDNGVFDLNEMRFRNGTPDDMVSKSTGYNYIEFDEDSEELKPVMTYFSQVQTDEELREYTLRLISSYISGKTKDQQMVFWTGSGCHARDTNICMADGTVKKVQDIELGDKVLGSDGRPRKVSVLYDGRSTMYKIIAHDQEKTEFVVNYLHRMALRSHYKPEVLHEIDNEGLDVFFVISHEMCAGNPIKITKQFRDIEEAHKYIENLNDNPHNVRYGEVVPVGMDRLVHMDDDVINYYKIFKMGSDMQSDVDFSCVELPIDDFFGFEIDGDKQYVMENMYVTYNSNGKSTTSEVIHKTLGEEYAKVLDITVLTRKRGGQGQATPELADKFATRFLSMNEPEHGEQMYVGQMKELVSGIEKIQARALYGPPFYYRPQFKLVLLCNDLPYIEDTTDGTWRRIRVLPWKSKFYPYDHPDYDPNNPSHFVTDGDLIEKMVEWRQPLMWLLIHKYWPQYIKYGLQEPDEVKKYTNNYKQNSDVYMEFIEKYIIETNNPSDKEKQDHVYETFVGWFKGAYPKKQVPASKELVAYFQKKGFKVDKYNIKGIEVSNCKDDDEQ